MSIQVTRLTNGMTVVTDSMAHLESAALGVWVRVGSRSEAAHENGISHFLEHMAFKGTRRRTARMIAEEIEAVGGEVNAATSLETTAFFVRILKSDVPLAIDILSDILTNSVFDEQESRREQHVILQEIGAAYDAPEDRVFDLFQETAFPDQAIGRPILGTQETVAGFGPDMLRAYLGNHYRGPQMVLGAAGAVDHDQIAALAQEKFHAIDFNHAADHGSARYVGGARQEFRDLMEVQVTLGFKGHSHKSEDFFAVQILASILGGGMSSRLFQEVRENRGLCYSVYAMHMAFSDTGVFALHAATGKKDLAELMPVLVHELGRAALDISPDELDRARTQLRAGLLMALESPAARASQVARQIFVYGRPLTSEELIEKIDAVTLDHVRSVARATMTGSTPTLSVVGPVDSIMGIDEISSRLNDHLGGGSV